MSIYVSFLAVLALSLIGLTVPHWPVFQRKAHPPILSVSAGVGITYVFLVLLPKLAEVQASLQVSEDEAAILPVDLHAYLSALAGFIVFLLIANKGFSDRADRTPSRLSFSETLVLVVFGIYYAQIGFLLRSWPSAIWFGYLGLVGAFAMHLVGINYHLWKRYPNRFPRVFRWVLFLCLLIGWMAAVIYEQLSGVVKFSTMFVAGGIIITAIREEIPAQKDANIPYFLATVLVTTIFVLFIEIILLD
ncbi:MULTISPECIES: hypothetical protein [Microbulbifer]|uniref:hypothetical protein n=1 Tax=Microbulbifer TaxID=48073 RepID=UPI001E5F5B93|nr:MULTISPECIES: hypothetical protein [Microbulbifer]UHQ54156.1 hypothetical protein LVE68_11575 [Microbulbifer sp. YPW16]